MSNAEEEDPVVEADPMAELAVQNAKYVKNCTELHMASKRIQVIAGFEPFVNLEVLWLNGNRLHFLEDLDTNVRVRELYAHDNQLRTLAGSISKFKFLNVLHVSGNRLHGLHATLDVLCGFQYLHHLELFGNPLSEETDYRLHVLKRLPWLEVFDRHAVTEEELQRAAWLGTSKEVARESAPPPPKAFVPELSGCVKVLEREVRELKVDYERRAREQELALCGGALDDDAGIPRDAQPPSAYTFLKTTEQAAEMSSWEWANFLKLCAAASVAEALRGGGDAAAAAEAEADGLLSVTQLRECLLQMKYFGRCLTGTAPGEQALPLMERGIGGQEQGVDAIIGALVEEGAEEGAAAGGEEGSDTPPRVNYTRFWAIASGHARAPGTATLRWERLVLAEARELAEELFARAAKLQRGTMALDAGDPRAATMAKEAAEVAQKAARLEAQVKEQGGSMEDSDGEDDE